MPKAVQSKDAQLKEQMDNNKTFTATILSVAKMMALISNLAIAATLSRLLPRSTYGTFCQILIIYSMSNTIITSGLTQSVYYFLPRIEPHQQKGFVLQSMSILAGFGVLIGAFLFFGADIIGNWWNNQELPAFLRSYALFPVFILPVMIAESVLMFFNRIYTVFLFNFFSRIFDLFCCSSSCSFRAIDFILNPLLGTLFVCAAHRFCYACFTNS